MRAAYAVIIGALVQAALFIPITFIPNLQLWFFLLATLAILLASGTAALLSDARPMLAGGLAAVAGMAIAQAISSWMTAALNIRAKYAVGPVADIFIVLAVVALLSLPGSWLARRIAGRRAAR
jgi:hypothetical protein